MSDDYITFSTKDLEKNLFNKHQCFYRYNYKDEISIFMELKKMGINNFTYLKHLYYLKKYIGGILLVNEYTLSKEECVDLYSYTNEIGYFIGIDPKTLNFNINTRYLLKVLLMFIRGPYNPKQWKNIIFPALNVYLHKDCEYTYLEVIFFTSQIYFLRGGQLENNNHWVMDSYRIGKPIRRFDVNHCKDGHGMDYTFDLCPKEDIMSEKYQKMNVLIINELNKNN